MFRLALHVPWFILTIEVPDGEVRRTATTCIAWDTELVAVLESLGNERAVGLLCMIPGWCSPTGRWAAREVDEVWELRTSRGRTVRLRDRHGEEFGDTPPGQPQQQELARRLILKLDPPPALEGVATTTTPSSERA